MNTPKAVSDYMRDMQRRSAQARWSALSPAERSARMNWQNIQATLQHRREVFAVKRQPALRSDAYWETVEPAERAEPPEENPPYALNNS